MAVTVSSTSTFQETAGNNTSITYAFAPGSVNRVVVCVVLDGSVDTDCTATYGGEAMTLAVFNNTNNRFTGIFYSDSTPPTSGDVVVTRGSTNTGAFSLVAYGLSGVDAASPLGDTVNDGLISGDPSPFDSGGIDTVAGDLIVSCYYTLTDNTVTAGAGQANSVEGQNAAVTAHLCCSTKASAGTVSLQYTYTLSAFAFHVAANFAQSAGGAVARRKKQLLLGVA